MSILDHHTTRASHVSPEPPPPPTHGPVHGAVGEVVATRRRGRRVVTAVVTVDDFVVVGLELVRPGDVLARAATDWLPPGRHTLRLRLPRRVTAGGARVVLRLADAGGHTTHVRVPVHVPAR